jgi:potassium-transporting ATPase KdpC subunit
MKKSIFQEGVLHAATSARIALVTILLCGGLYPVLIYGVARILAPESADGSLIRNEKGAVAGSRLIAQEFTRPGYFWPRPSAVSYNAAGAGGSNLSPASPLVRKRAGDLISSYGADVARPLPADLATASGSGLDPHISLAAALFQAPRIAEARGMALAKVVALVKESSADEHLPSWTGGALVNVLVLNMKLDANRQQGVP